MNNYNLISAIILLAFILTGVVFNTFTKGQYLLFGCVMLIMWLFAFLYNKSIQNKDSRKQVSYSLAAIGVKFNLLLIFVIIYQFTFKLGVTDAIILFSEYVVLMIAFYFLLVKKEKDKKKVTF